MLSPSSSNALPFATISLVLLSCLPTSRAQTASDYYVRSLPGAPDGPLLKMHAGHVEVSPDTHGSLFFWHYQNKRIEDRQRTVIWLNGGPGCSSMDGNLMEVGPYRVGEGGKLRYNNGSWDEFANLLFVDNPVGTGFSFVDSNSYLHELDEMAEQFMVFLENWFKIFPEHESNDLYLAGESYAGQHIPYISRAILDRNKKSTGRQWNLRGLLIGNGWISNEFQSPVNLKFAVDSGLLKKDTKAYRNVERQQKRCIARLAETGGEHVDTSECEGILQAILRETRDTNAPEDKQCVNMYDIKLRDKYASCGMNWPPDLDTVYPYLRDPQVIAALNIDKSKKSTGWMECNGQVSAAFQARNSKPSFDLLPDLLAEIPIILFSGADDLICNHAGTENLIANLDWNGGVGFPESAATKHWTFDGEDAGTYRSDRNLTYLLFHNSSHMVPFDYPKRSRDMLDRFIGIEASSRFPDSQLDGEAPVKPGTPSHSEASTSPVSSEDTKVQVPSEDQMTKEEAAIAEQAKWNAYYRSGWGALILVVIMAGVFGWWVWRDRRRRAGYRGLEGGQGSFSGPVMDGIRDAGSGAVRMEAFRPYKSGDEGDGTDSESDGEGGRRKVKFANGNGHSKNGVSPEQARRYSLGSVSESSTGGSPPRKVGGGG